MRAPPEQINLAEELVIYKTVCLHVRVSVCMMPIKIHSFALIDTKFGMKHLCGQGQVMSRLKMITVLNVL